MRRALNIEAPTDYSQGTKEEPLSPSKGLHARRIFKIYERSNRMTDWALFQDLCTYRAMDQADLDVGSSDAVLTEFLCCCVWGAHDLLINGGSWIFRTRDSDSEA